MTILTLEDLSARLVELESHPGLEHLRRYSPTDATAKRWEVVEAALLYLWSHLSDADLERANVAYTQKVLTGPLPVSTDIEPQLRSELEALTAPDATALRDLQRRIESALERVRLDEALARGVLDRRTELKGRLRAYEAKAARLGLAEDADLLSSRRIAAGLLTRQPCDLRAVTQAIVDYQQLVSQKREETQ
jgi:hypothetical protein